MLRRFFRHRSSGIGAMQQMPVIVMNPNPIGFRMSHDTYGGEDQWDRIRAKAGNREWVGYGASGNPDYIDCIEFPFPAIRYKECTPELMALREKERGDWKKLSIHEKKTLYRFSFRQTFAEFEEPAGMWRYCWGLVFLGISVALWFQTFLHQFVMPKWPHSLSKEARIAQYYRQVDLNMRPLDGIPRPPGAEKRVFPKNKEMLKKYQETVND
ncbi:hypothetical protein QAD02_017652 [Eretmocerus hayati]|uniref:Uncharacterized protein n=1 Tax=Eretmocerus hayati TaxID=131215 RepID=A0ACC2PEJ9_9HYME|nr:hypothetical protein QAD02_017652 [Eretmocerus hayati]